MNKIRLGILTLLGVVSLLYAAGSEATFPSGFKNFTSVKTPLTQIGALPGCNADVSGLPKIYQETVATYCGIKQGGPGKVDVLVSPGAESTYKARNGKFKDGDSLVLWLKDLKVLFVTQYKNGKPLYGAYTEDGKDVAGAPGSGLNPQDCRTCHTGYAAFCVNGQCGAYK